MTSSTVPKISVLLFPSSPVVLSDYGLSYLSLRTSIGLWTAFLCLLLVATDASSLVCYITRFTEEAFAALICIIFIYEALEKLVHLGESFPINMQNHLDNLTFYTDFAVFLTIMIMVLVDYLVGVPSPKLHVPDRFEPTSNTRGWLISPLGPNPWWTLLAAAVPALLCTILVFMDQQITAVIVNRKENKLKKGCGYHLDLLVVAVMLGVCSIMGLPWFVAATVLSISHVNSLKLESECAAPGEQPKFLGIREQRVTGFMIFVLMGCSVFMTSVLKFIPMPVLYGVFLYMGVSSLRGIQDAQRMLEEVDGNPPYDSSNLLKIPIKNLKGRSDPSEVNISDEMAKSGVWKSVSMNSDGCKALKYSNSQERLPSVQINVESEDERRVVDAETSL
eukprot:superscaffoldBa00003804_g17724